MKHLENLKRDTSSATAITEQIKNASLMKTKTYLLDTGTLSKSKDRNESEDI